MEEFLDDIRLDSQVVSSIKLPVPPSLGFELTFVRPALNSYFRVKWHIHILAKN